MLTITLDTPIGPLTVVTSGGSVLAAGFTRDEPALLALVHPDLRPPTGDDGRAVVNGTAGVGPASGTAPGAGTASGLSAHGGPGTASGPGAHGGAAANGAASPGADADTDAGVEPIAKAVAAYFAGDLTAIDAVPVVQCTGGAFMAHTWDVLRGVRPGTPLTYRELAEQAGRPAAVRAAAAACARNAAALFVPCHRVVRTDGGLGGYRWGLDVKRYLLAHERHI